jgi:MFS family permease
MQAAGLILGPLFASALLATHMSHNLIWRILVGFGAVPALAVYWSRRHLKETPRFLAAAAKEEDAQGRLINAKHFDRATHSVSFWDGFHRLVNDNKLLMRLIGASAAWFLMDAAYYGNTVSSPSSSRRSTATAPSCRRRSRNSPSSPSSPRPAMQSPHSPWTASAARPSRSSALR